MHCPNHVPVSALLRIRLVGVAPALLGAHFAESPFGPFVLHDTEPAPADPVEAILVAAAAVDAPDTAFAPADWAASAVVVVDADESPPAVLQWLARGAEDVLSPADLEGAVLGRRVRAAIERKRVERASRKAYSTDLATGLPHRLQLIEHLSQLLALREREPAPMAVLALRIEGFTTTQSRLGTDAADALRRKIAVRLRAAVRASDIVAALDEESFAVLLGSMLVPADAERVARKLAQVLMEPFSVGGIGVAIAVAVGVALYPEEGSDPDGLLRKAIGMALDEPAQGRIGMANFQESGARPLDAANDD